MHKTTSSLIRALHHADATAPEWLHLMPSTDFTGADGRGPFAKPDTDALIALFNKDGLKLAVDENHSTDLAAKQGFSAPARGWIVELQKRDDGLYGRVEWTPEGKRMMASKEYGFLSPVFMHSATKPYKVSKVLRVALTNDPNLPFLKSLHSKEDADMLEELRKALGLPETADEAAVMVAVKAAHAAQAVVASTQTATAALMSRIAEAAGVAADTAPDVLVTAIQSRGKATATEAENAALRTQLTSLQTQFTTFASTTAKDKAEAVIDAAIAEGKVVKVLRDHMISRHMKDPAEVESELKVMPSLNAGGLGGRVLPESGGVMTTEDDQLMAMMGIDPKAYADTAKALHGKGN
jgi:phage I-like protein